MPRISLVAVVLAVVIPTLVFGKSALSRAPAGRPSSTTQSVIAVSVAEKNVVWLAIGVNERGQSYQPSYSRILLYKTSLTVPRWEKVLDTAAVPTLKGLWNLGGLWIFGSGHIAAWFLERVYAADRDMVLRSVDGGRRWRSSLLRFVQPDGFDGQVSFISLINPSEGWMMVQEGVGMQKVQTLLYHSRDGGNQWKEIARSIPFEPSPSGLHSEAKSGMVFRDARRGWIGTAPVTGQGFLYVTRDGGATWEEQSLPAPPGSKPNDDFLNVLPPRFFGTRHGVAVAHRTDGAFAYMTSDGGLTWGDPRPLPRVSRPDILRAWDMLTVSRWAVGSERTFWLTSNGGRTWLEQLVPLPDTHKIHSVAFLNFDQIWLIGYQESQAGVRIADYLLETRDAGKGWTHIRLPQIP